MTTRRRFTGEFKAKVALDCSGRLNRCGRGTGFRAGCRSRQAAATRADTLTRLIARRMLYARAVRLNSPRTFSSCGEGVLRWNNQRPPRKEHPRCHKGQRSRAYRKRTGC